MNTTILEALCAILARKVDTWTLADHVLAVQHLTVGQIMTPEHTRYTLRVQWLEANGWSLEDARFMASLDSYGHTDAWRLA